jgi:hypothetical protein
VLLAAEGRGTRSIADVGVQPRIVSNWRWRFSVESAIALKTRLR